MSIVRVKSFFISGVNCNWYSVIPTKKTEGQRLVKRNLALEANPVSPGVAGAFYANFSERAPRQRVKAFAPPADSAIEKAGREKPFRIPPKPLLNPPAA